MQDEDFWLLARDEMMLDPASVNLNAGTLSPTPRPVFDAVDHLRRMQASAPSDFHWRQVQPLLARSRSRLAEYIHVRDADLLLLPNVTWSLNIVLASLTLPRGSEILTCDHEYGAMLYCLERFAQKHGCTVRSIKLPYRATDPQQIVDAFTSGFGPNTRLLFFSHFTTSTGLLLPAKRLTDLARSRGEALVFIDGAHAPGMIPINVTDIGADFYGANCHKWMMAPAGAGFLHVAPHRKASVESIITSWGWEYDRAKLDDDSNWGGTFWQREHEFQGTLDRTPQMTIADALDFRERLGGDALIARRVRELADYARGALSDVGLMCVNPPAGDLTGCLLAFEFPCKDVMTVRDLFWHDHKIECPVTVVGEDKFLRVSCAWFNTQQDIDRLAQAVQIVRAQTAAS